MPHQVVWTQAALDDLYEILVEEENPEESNQLEETAFFQSSHLSDHPHLGPIFEPLGKPYRHLVVHPNYRLVYVARAGHIFIMAFLHTRRKLELAWREKRRPIQPPPR